MTPRKPAAKKTAPAEEEPRADAAGAPSAEETPTAQAESAVTVEADRMVVFFLEGQKYALPIDRVQEIQQIVAYTEVPDDTRVMLGMVNLRGFVVPLVDVRPLVGLPPREFTLETPMVICRLRDSLVALVVDEVEDVATIPEGCLQKPSRLHVIADKLLGVCRMDPDLVFLIDLERLVPDDASLAQTVGEAR